MPISPQCPRRCAQSDARGSIKWIVRAPLGGAPSQGSELPSLTPEASLERLVPLVDYLAAWKLLPNVSQWVLQTVEKGYRIQFAFPPPALQRRDSHTGGPRAGSGYGTRGESPIKEGGHRGGPSSREGIRVLQPVFHSSQEGWRLRPIIDLRQLNHSVSQLKFKMLTLRQVVSQIRSEDWFVTIDLKTHTSTYPSVRVTGSS